MMVKNYGLGRALCAAVVLCGMMVPAAAVSADVFNMGPGLTSLETVRVGNAGNAADTTGYGSVAYEYNIGKYEVTAGQYTEFLNAVAATDTYALYAGSAIRRSGVSGSYTYSVDPAFANHPVGGVSFWDACRFANWLHNGQPTGLQGPGTTEDGAYTFLTPVGNIYDDMITRNAGATWAVTSEDEWYKAAYYNPATSSYYQYPTSSNTAPGNDMADISGNNANSYPVYDSDPYYIMQVGEFQNSDSPYGTFDQGGNVWEWTEGIRPVYWYDPFPPGQRILSEIYRIARGRFVRLGPRLHAFRLPL